MIERSTFLPHRPGSLGSGERFRAATPLCLVQLLEYIFEMIPCDDATIADATILGKVVAVLRWHLIRSFRLRILKDPRSGRSGTHVRFASLAAPVDVTRARGYKRRVGRGREGGRNGGSRSSRGLGQAEAPLWIWRGLGGSVHRDRGAAHEWVDHAFVGRSHDPCECPNG